MYKLTLSLLLSIALLAACSTPYRPPVFPDVDTHFPGLADVMANASGHAADVLLVHGICTHDASWAPKTVAQLMAALQANLPTPDGAPQPPAQAEADTGPQVEIVPSIVHLPAGTLQFDALIWSPLTQTLKRQLCYDQTDKSALCQNTPPFTPQRARWNALLKDELLDDCLSDAIIYQGVAREQMQARMRDAILRATAGQDAARPLVVIAESLGSNLLFDTLLHMLDEPSGSRAAQAARQTLDRMTYLVMAANPIPLLALADQPLAGGQPRLASATTDVAATATATATNHIQSQPASTSSHAETSDHAASRPAQTLDSLQRLLQRRALAPSASTTRQPLVLIAFTDPNDVLSYTLQRQRYAADGIAVYNILVSNAPTYLGLLERPDLAHTDYLLNPDVGRLIVCGQPASALCK